ncbi:hypothetical protein [Calycomorphotria hydatis]|uniref:HEAT repeat protein n=1 Tax=Calycomorphotria hydatis TaxID=2528027 RepID=A0A517TAD5_9PLAN|nr:hypothetical protein [Calycomorphotria hydatis]QDT65341.1 hypothetical protein V22_25900 [Calycomorphotria hydatis]
MWTRLTISICTLLLAHTALAEPIDPAIQPSLREQISRSTNAVLAGYMDGRWIVVRSLLGSPDGPLVGKRVKVENLPGWASYSVLIRPALDQNWSTPIPLTRSAAGYLVKQLESSPRARRETAARYLMHSDPIIRDETIAELARDDYENVKAVADMIPAQHLREALSANDLAPHQLRTAGLLLGLCGQGRDETLLLDLAGRDREGFGLGEEGPLIGYLLLRGPDGLDTLRRKVIESPDTTSVTLRAAISALDFLHQHEPQRFAEADLQRSLVAIASRPEATDMVAAQLAQWGNWDGVPAMVAIFHENNDQDPVRKKASRIAILRYLKDCARCPHPESQESKSQARTALNSLENAYPDVARRATALSGTPAQTTELY